MLSRGISPLSQLDIQSKILAQGAYAPAQESLLRRGSLKRLQGFIVIRMRSHLRHVFQIGDLPVLVDDEHRSRQQRNGQPFNQHAVVLTKRVVMRIGKRLHGADVLGAAKTLLGKRTVEANRVGSNLVFERSDSLLEF